MKLLHLLFILAIPIVGTAQTKQDHINQVEKFVKLYNDRQTDSICGLFPDEKTTGIRCEWQYAERDHTYETYGKITSFEFIGVDSNNNRKVMQFKLNSTSRGDVLLSTGLDKDRKFIIFLMEKFR